MSFKVAIVRATGNVDRAMEIRLGSAIRIALLLTLINYLVGSRWTWSSANPLDLFAFAGTALIVQSVASEDETIWFEGLLLVGVHVLLALGFFLVG